MIPHKKIRNQMSFFNNFEDILNQKHPLYVLAQRIDWKQFEEAFLPLYSQDNGRPAKPVRLMVGLLILKHVSNVSDEVIV